MSPLPLFILATAAMAVIAFFMLVMRLKASIAPRPRGALRRRRAEEQIRWDRMNPPAAEPGL